MFYLGVIVIAVPVVSLLLVLAVYFHKAVQGWSFFTDEPGPEVRGTLRYGDARGEPNRSLVPETDQERKEREHLDALVAWKKDAEDDRRRKELADGDPDLLARNRGDDGRRPLPEGGP